MELDWAALSAYPHTIDGGRDDRHAFRLAMYARRNSCEALFGALKVGHKLGLDGADRTHTDNESTLETLLSLGLLLRTAFAVAYERTEQGLRRAAVRSAQQARSLLIHVRAQDALAKCSGF